MRELQGRCEQSERQAAMLRSAAEASETEKREQSRAVEELMSRFVAGQNVFHQQSALHCAAHSGAVRKLTRLCGAGVRGPSGAKSDCGGNTHR